MNFNDLISKVQQITQSGLPFMEGRTKLDTNNVLGQILTVDEYGYLEGEEGEYIVLTVKEHPNNFIYGSSVITGAFKKLEEQLTVDEMNVLIESGLVIRIEEVLSSNKRKYKKIVFFPR